MKFYFGMPPENEAFSPELEGWKPIKEPSVWGAQLLSLPICIATIIPLNSLWGGIFARLPDGDRLWMAILFVVSMIAHELIHGVLNPHWGTSSKTILGCWPSKLILYTHYDDILSRYRFVVILIGPFIVLSILPLVGALLCGTSPFYLAFVSFINGVVSCVDLLGAILVLVFVPYGAKVRNKGWKTYYKKG